MAAVQVNADALLGNAVLVVSVDAVFADMALGPVFQQHPFPYLQGGIGAGADGDNFPGHVHAHDAGRLTAATPGTHTHVGPVQGAAMDPQHNLARRHLRVGQVAVHHGFRPARFLKINGFHGKYLLKYEWQVARILQEGKTGVKAEKKSPLPKGQGAHVQLLACSDLGRAMPHASERIRQSRQEIDDISCC